MHDFRDFCGRLRHHRSQRHHPSSRHVSNENGVLQDASNSRHSSWNVSRDVLQSRHPNAVPIVDGPGSARGSECDPLRPHLEHDDRGFQHKKNRSVSSPSTLASKAKQLELSCNSPRDSSSIKTPSQKLRKKHHTNAPDRFVPLRVESSSSFERYRTTREVQHLSVSERLIRNEIVSDDPFTTPPFMAARRRLEQENSGAMSTQSLPNNRIPHVADSTPSAPHPTHDDGKRPSYGTVWAVGGMAPVPNPVDDGRGHFLRSRTHAQIYSFPFAKAKIDPQQELDNYHGRVASALDIDRVRRVLDFDKCATVPSPSRSRMEHRRGALPRTFWDGKEWMTTKEEKKPIKRYYQRSLPAPAFKILDAPNLRDDFYCSVLAYSSTCDTLAVGLGNALYTWTEAFGAHPTHTAYGEKAYVTSVSFSSSDGNQSILAIGRGDGSLILQSTYDSLPRFEVQQPYAVSSLSWRPQSTSRPSKNPLNPGVSVQTEDIVIGDEVGTIYYYIVEWPPGWEVTRDTWPGTMTLVAKVSVHEAQICGLVWAPKGDVFASGGNDDICCLFSVDDVLGNKEHGSIRELSKDQQDSSTKAIGVNDEHAPDPPEPGERTDPRLDRDRTSATDGTKIRRVRTSADSLRTLWPGDERHCWPHAAAVKAIAFCPWAAGLIATGGGSRDKCIHFFHTTSGAPLATIAVAAQVTSLIWSTTRREIAATFGYSLPEHPYRIAIFSWPECRQVAAIPWPQNLRALHAISYPKGPVDESVKEADQPSSEGCLVVAASDSSVKFHEVWARHRKSLIGGPGSLAGSDILECLEGIDKEGDVIR